MVGAGEGFAVVVEGLDDDLVAAAAEVVDGAAIEGRAGADGARGAALAAGEASASSVLLGDVPDEKLEDVPNRKFSTRTIALNFYPPSNRVNDHFWDATSGGFRLMANGPFVHHACARTLAKTRTHIDM